MRLDIYLCVTVLLALPVGASAQILDQSRSDAREISDLEREHLQSLRGSWVDDAEGTCRDGDEGLVVVEGTSMPGYHFFCQILNVASGRDGLTGVMSCGGEGEEWSGMIKQDFRNPDAMRLIELVEGREVVRSYSRCEGNPRAFSGGGG